jgi:hypothetical protein
MVWGEGGRSLKAANDTIGPIATIAWAVVVNGDVSTKKLIVGFKESQGRIDLMAAFNQNAIRDTWSGVRFWAEAAFGGNSESLNEWLSRRHLERLRNGGSFDPANPHHSLQQAYQKAGKQTVGTVDSEARALAKEQVLQVIARNATVGQTKMVLNNWVYACRSKLPVMTRINIAAVTWREATKNQQDEAIVGWLNEAYVHMRNNRQ